MSRCFKARMSYEIYRKIRLYQPASFVEARELRLSIPVSYIMNHLTEDFFDVGYQYHRQPPFFVRRIVFFLQEQDLNVLQRDGLQAWLHVVYFCRMIGRDVSKNAEGLDTRVEMHCAAQANEMNLVLYGGEMRNVKCRCFALLWRNAQEGHSCRYRIEQLQRTVSLWISSAA